MPLLFVGHLVQVVHLAALVVAFFMLGKGRIEGLAICAAGFLCGLMTVGDCALTFWSNAIFVACGHETYTDVGSWFSALLGIRAGNFLVFSLLPLSVAVGYKNRKNS